MKKPTLVIMAAGMGSRFGGLKQIEPVSDKGEIILDFSLYDAVMAGFKKAIFIIKKENEEAFRALVDDRAGKYIGVEYAFQCLDDLPEGYFVPEGREKPWGTAHAVLAARRLADGPIAVVQTPTTITVPVHFRAYISSSKLPVISDKYDFCMAGYNIENTLTENGYVSRGVCQTSEEGLLSRNNRAY